MFKQPQKSNPDLKGRCHGFGSNDRIDGKCIIAETQILVFDNYFSVNKPSIIPYMAPTLSSETETKM